jgi:hypothetical protein
MNSIFTITIVLVGIVAVLLTIVWLGFQIEQESFPPHPEETKDAGAVNVSPDIPEPVKRY